jgi:conjugal transfer pilus assembly protein TraL
MDKYAIPVFLDEPERIGLWTMDEFLILAVPFGLGIITGHIIIGIFAGFFGWMALRKAKAGRATSWVLHMAYWHLPANVTNIRYVPPSHLRLMVG